MEHGFERDRPKSGIPVKGLELRQEVVRAAGGRAELRGTERWYRRAGPDQMKVSPELPEIPVKYRMAQDRNHSWDVGRSGKTSKR